MFMLLSHTTTETRTANIFRVSASVYPENPGVVQGAGWVARRMSVTVTAIANSGYTFSRWEKNGTVVSTSTSYQVTKVTADHDLVAVFTST